MPLEFVNPESLGAPKGWNHGVLAPREGRTLYIAGMAGWRENELGKAPGFAAQFAHALDQALTVLREAGGVPEDVARMTVYVTDLGEYRDSRTELGAIWRERFGRHYPAMALVEVSGLVDHGAKLEIETTAVIAAHPGSR